MGTPPLDLLSLAQFNPTQVLCPNCRAGYPNLNAFFAPQQRLACPLCRFELGLIVNRARIFEELRAAGNVVGHDIDLTWGSRAAMLDHLTALGTLADEIRRNRIRGLHTFRDLLRHATSYIHVLTFGFISPSILELLAVKAGGIGVRGVVASPSRRIRQRQLAALDDYPEVGVRVASANRGLIAMPHGKLLIIDGFLAVSGSLNMTKVAWERASQGLEVVHVTSVPEEVARLNNHFFAPAWLAAAAPDTPAGVPYRRRQR